MVNELALLVILIKSISIFTYQLKQTLWKR